MDTREECREECRGIEDRIGIAFRIFTLFTAKTAPQNVTAGLLIHSRQQLDQGIPVIDADQS